MFVSSGQFYVFISCVSFGAISGFLFYVINYIKLIIKPEIFCKILDFVTMLIISFLYVVYSKRLNFPSFRLYMPFGVLLGLVCYFKSFNIILAKAQKKFYNKYIKNKGNKGNGRTKVKKGS